jgi:hypothetical protein
MKPDRLTITFGDGQRRRLEAIAKLRRTNLTTVIRWALDAYTASNASGLGEAKRQCGKSKGK